MPRLLFLEKLKISVLAPYSDLGLGSGDRQDLAQCLLPLSALAARERKL